MKVIKLGGSLLDDVQRRDAALGAIANAWNAGEQLVLVHGGGKHVDAALAKAGIAKRTHAGLRITDDATLEIVVSVLAGTVNKMLVAELTKLGVRAAGISGCDASTLVAAQHPPVGGVDLGHVGEITKSNPTLVRSMLNYGVMPVVSSVAMSAGGELFNVNADAAASALAVSLNASMLHFITDVAGLLDADGSVIPQIDPPRVATLMQSGVVNGGMLPKLHSALRAAERGVVVRIGEEGGSQIVAA
ncbi:MAG TPA: acetylglutamate kinase [Thermoanaerobaculia bacterium]|jgi:acetylglutamate kinase